MDIAKLGVEIDPRNAAKGADRIERELDDIGRSADKNLGKIDKGSRQAARSMQKTGRTIGMIGKTSSGTFSQMTSGALGLLDGIGLMNGGFGRIVGRAQGAARGISALTAGARGLSKGASGSGAALGRMGVSATSAAGSLGGLAIKLAPLAAVIAAVTAAALAAVVAFKALKMAFGFLMEGLAMAGQLQKFEISLNSLTGSAAETEKVMNSLRASAEKTGISIADQAGSVRKFIALGFDPDKAVKLQKNILDVAGAVGLTTTEANLLGSALAQVQSKGVVSMEELRQQIAEKGIPIIDELQRKTGLFGDEFFKAVAKGSIASDQLIDVFLNMEGGFGRFAGGAEKMAVSYEGAIGRIKTGLDLLKADVAKPLADALTPALTKLADFINGAAPAARAFGEYIANGVKVVMEMIQSGQIMNALGLALAAGIEWAFGFMVRNAVMGFARLTEILANALIKGIEFFFNGFTASVDKVGEYIEDGVGSSLGKNASGFQKVMITLLKVLGTITRNSFGEAFDAVATGFKKAMVAVVNLAISGLNKAVSIAIDAVPGGRTATNLLGVPTKIPKMDQPERVNFFEPKKVDFDGLDNALRDLLPTSRQEDFGGFVRDMLAQFNKKNPGAPPPTPNPGAPPPTPNPAAPPPTPNPAAGPLPKTEEIPEATAAKVGKVKKATEEALTPIQELIKTWGDFDANLQEFTVGTLQTFANSMTDGFMAMIDGSKSASEAFGQMAASILQEVVRMIIQLTIQAALVRAIGGGPLGGFLQGLPGGGGSIPQAIPVAHGGASGGVDSVGKRMSGSTSSSERRAIIDKNETVLTGSQSRDLEMELTKARGGDDKKDNGQQGITIVNALDPQTVQDAIAANPSTVLNAISKHRKQFKAMMR